METTVVDRLRDVIEKLNCNKSSFARKLGLSQTSIATIFMRGKTLSTPVLEKIILTFPEINIDWLITGQGFMLKPETPTPSINYEYKGSPYYDIDFVGGFDLVLNDQTQNPDYYINFEPYNKPGVMWCNVTGQSMEPEINHGDMIAIKELQDWRTYIPFGEVYGIVTTEHRTIKRVSKADKDGFFKLIPTNKDAGFVSQDIPVSIIQKVFMVLGSVKRF